MAVLLSRAIGPIPVSVIENESHEASIEITENPIEDGSTISDHAYRNPKRVTLDIVSHGPRLTFQALKALQVSRVPFTLVSGLDIDKNMLIKSITPEQNSQFSRVFKGKVELQEVIIVGTTYTASQTGNAGTGQGAGSPSKGKPGGANSTRAATPSKQGTSGAVTQDRATSTVARGDNPTNTVAPSQSGSILHGMFN